MADEVAVLNSQARSAFDLKKAWGDSLRLKIVDDAGHSAKEVGIKRLLTEVRVSWQTVAQR